MGKFYTYPHEKIRVIDQSARDVYIPEEIPLHLPLFVVFAEKGQGMAYGVYSELKEKFGEGTFDSKSPYFNHQSLFLRTACQSQPVFMYRLIPEDAKTASLVLEAHVWDDNIPQWQRAADGSYLLNRNGNKIPLLSEGPIIEDYQWNTDTVIPDGSTYDLTIIASNPSNPLDTLTYNVSAITTSSISDIEQDNDNPNIFHITIANNNTIQKIKLKIMITDSNGNVTISYLTKMMRLESDWYLDQYWTNSEAYGNSSQTLTVELGDDANASILTTDDSNVIIIPDATNSNVYNILYPEYESYPHDVNFTLNVLSSGTQALEESFVQSVNDVPSGTQITKPGVKIQWKTRPLAPNETITGLLSSTYINADGKEVTVYPILAFQPNGGPGAYGNNMGVSLWWTHESDTDLILENQALLFNIAYYDKPYGMDTTIHVRDFYNAISQEFMFKPDARDKAVDMAKDFDSVMQLAFRGTLPLDYHVYINFIQDLSTRVFNAEQQEGRILELTNEWMANIFEAKSTENIPYYRTEIVIDTDSALLDKDVIHYCSNGSDGTITKENYEILASKFFMSDTFPELQDDRRYPFNHVYDSGFTLETKKTMFNLLSLRNDVHIISATQCAYEEPNTEMEDQSVGNSLLIKALLYPESAIDGTQCCRVTIFSQCCHINFDDNYTNIVPMTLFALLARCKFHSATFVKGEWKGLPNSSCDFIKDINWAPYLPRTMQLHWDTGINYCQYYDMTRLHYRDIISVYPLQTSLLSSDTFVTYLVYLKQLVKKVYEKYVGMEEPVNKLKDKIEKELNNCIYNTFKTYIKVIPTVYQTDLDEQLGFSMTVELGVYDSVAKRIWNIPIYVRRIEDLNAK